MAARLDVEDFLQKKVYLEVCAIFYSVFVLLVFNLDMHIFLLNLAFFQVLVWHTFSLYTGIFTLYIYRCLNSEQIEVKVRENWRQDEGLLKHYGYGGQIRVI